MDDLKLNLLPGKSNLALQELSIDEKATLAALLKGRFPVMLAVIKKNRKIQQEPQAVIESYIFQLLKKHDLKKLNQMQMERSPKLIIDFKNYISNF